MAAGARSISKDGTEAGELGLIAGGDFVMPRASLEEYACADEKRGMLTWCDMMMLSVSFPSEVLSPSSKLTVMLAVAFRDRI